MKTALVTGVYGQDGSYLCEILIENGYQVHGVIRKELSVNSQMIRHTLSKKGISPIEHIADLNDYNELKKILLAVKPNEIYHVAANHVSSEGVKINKDYYEKCLFDYNIKSTSNILSICWNYLQDTRIVTAGSCLMFDNSNTDFQTADTPFDSKSLYGLAKIAENSLVKYYRNKGLHCSTAILYNHESSRRSAHFVTKKIVHNLLEITKGKRKQLMLGNIAAKKDWGYAKDYAQAMFLMANADRAKDYIVSSGELHSIKNFIEICANKLQLKNWQQYIVVDESIIDRKIEGQLYGDCSEIEKELNWKRTITFEQLVELMISEENGL